MFSPEDPGVTGIELIANVMDREVLVTHAGPSRSMKPRGRIHIRQCFW